MKITKWFSLNGWTVIALIFMGAYTTTKISQYGIIWGLLALPSLFCIAVFVSVMIHLINKNFGVEV